MTPRGIRNNNPGNLNFAHQPGAVLEPGPNARFARFPTAEAGLAALRDQLILYNKRDGLDTVQSVISKWAPASENNTDAYIRGVSHAMGVRPFQQLGPFTPSVLTGLLNAIIQFENGENPYGSLVAKVAGAVPEKASV